MVDNEKNNEFIIAFAAVERQPADSCEWENRTALPGVQDEGELEPGLAVENP